jgi:hypothetical protein
MRAVEQRWDVVLGKQRQRPSDSFCFLLWGLVYRCVGEACIGLMMTFFYFAQVGDGSITDRYTPVSVVGLSSGVAMIALGEVR